jgi:hypothetical protein
LGIWLSFAATVAGKGPGWPDFARWSVLIGHFAVATAALSAGRRKGGVIAEAGAEYNRSPDFFGPRAGLRDGARTGTTAWG